MKLEKIYSAVENFDIDFLKKVVEKNKIDINMSINEKYDTLLIWSIENNIWDLIKPILINKNLDINKLNFLNVNAVSSMIVNILSDKISIEDKKKYSKVVQSVLYRKGIDLNNNYVAQKPSIKTSWQYVYDARNQMPTKEENAIIEELVQSFARKEGLVTNDGQNELMYACQICDEDLVNKIFEYGYYDINAKDKDNFTALHYAIMGGNENIVNTLLRVDGIDLSIKANGFGEEAFIFSLLEAAVEKDETKIEVRINIAKRLSKLKGIDINSEDAMGYIPLRYAADLKDLTIFNDLIERKDLDIDLVNMHLTGIAYSLLEKKNAEGLDALVKLFNLEGISQKELNSALKACLVKAINSEEDQYSAAFDRLIARKNFDINAKSLNDSNVLLESILAKNAEAVDKVLEREEVDVNKPLVHGYLDTTFQIQDIENAHKLIRHKSFDPSTVDENGSNIFGHIFSDVTDALDTDSFSAVCSFVMDECDINNIETLLNHVDNKGNDAMMNAVLNNIDADDIEVFLANLKKHFGYVEIDFDKTNQEGKSLKDIVKERFAHKTEVEINRVVKIFKDYKNANFLKEAKEKDRIDDIQTIELEPVVIEDNEI